MMFEKNLVYKAKFTLNSEHKAEENKPGYKKKLFLFKLLQAGTNCLRQLRGPWLYMLLKTVMTNIKMKPKIGSRILNDDLPRQFHLAWCRTLAEKLSTYQSNNIHTSKIWYKILLFKLVTCCCYTQLWLNIFSSNKTMIISNIVRAENSTSSFKQLIVGAIKRI